MKLTMTSTRKQAFTLIELLAVIAIIGILFTLVSPQIGKARLKGKLTQQAAKARYIVEAITAYESGSRYSTGWPRANEMNTANSTEFLVSLVEGGYLDVDYSFFAAPGMRPATDKIDFIARKKECNAWSILLELNDSVAGNTPAVFMSSYSVGSASFSSEYISIGEKGFAFSTKNGEAVVVEARDMKDAVFNTIFDLTKLSSLNIITP